MISTMSVSRPQHLQSLSLSTPQMNRDSETKDKVLHLLQSVYGKVETLEGYLRTVITDPGCLTGLQQHGDKPRYTNLLNTLVVCGGTDTPPPVFSSHKQLSHQHEIIVKVVERMQRSSSSKNVITSGFGSASGNVLSQSSGSLHVDCTTPSHACSLLMSRPWTTLLSRVGDEVMMHLLESKTLFAHSKPSCYVQLTGPPVYDLPTDQLFCNKADQMHAKRSTHTPRFVKLTGLCKKTKDTKWRLKRKKSAINHLAEKKRKNEEQLKAHTEGKIHISRRSSNSKASTSRPNRPQCGSSKQKRSASKAGLDKLDGSAKRRRRGERQVDQTKSKGTRTPVLGTRNTRVAKQKIKSKATERSENYILKRSVLYSSSRKEGLPDKHFLETLTLDEPGVKNLIRNIFILSDAKPIDWPKNSTLKDPEIPSQRSKFTSLKNKGKNMASLPQNPSCETDHTVKIQEGVADSVVVSRGPRVSSSREQRPPVGSEGYRGTEADVYQSAPHLVDALKTIIKINRRCNHKAVLEKWCPHRNNKLKCAESSNDKTSPVPHLNAPVFSRINKSSGRLPSCPRSQESHGEKTSKPQESHFSPIPNPQKTSLPTDKAQGPVHQRKHRCTSEKKKMVKLLNSHFEFKKVYLWLRAVCRQVFPVQLWGAPINQRRFFRCLYSFLKAGKFERMSTSQPLSGMKVEKIAFLSDFKSHRDREVALTLFVHWLLTGYCNVLLKAYFYVTDAGTYRNRLFYYRKPTWAAVETMALQDAVTDGHFTPISKAQVGRLVKRGALTMSTLRFLPKVSGVRPIVALGRRTKGAGTRGMSANKQLQNLFHVLSSVKREDPESLGSSVLGRDEVYAAWRKFVDRRKDNNDKRPLHFVKVDIEHCYDSMNQQRLIHIVSEYIKRHPEYVVRRYVKVIRDGGKVKVHFCRQVTPLVDFRPDPVQFTSTLQEGAPPVHDALIVDQMPHRVESADSLLSQLTAHVKMNMVTMHGQEYLQTQGISQGSVLSPLLCSLYYGRMEQEHLPQPAQDELLLRHIDDFLLVTPHLPRATHFLNTLLQGVPDYNCHVNAAKTLTSFTVPGRPEVSSLSPKALFPWCGLLLNTETLEVMADYTRYSCLRASDILTYDTSHTPGAIILPKLIRCAKLQCQLILVDSAVCSKPTVTSNLHQMAQLLTHRFMCCNEALPVNRNASHNLPFFTGILLNLAQAVGKLYIHKLRRVSSAPDLHELEVTWVFLAAVVQTLAGRRSRYRRLEVALRRHQRHISKSMTRDDLKWFKTTTSGVTQITLL